MLVGPIWLSSLGQSKGQSAMAPHSSTLAWKIPWMEEPGGLQSMGSLCRTRLSDFTFTFRFHALEKEMATHSSVLAWRIPETREPGGLPSMGLHRVRHDWSDLAKKNLLIYFQCPEMGTFFFLIILFSLCVCVYVLCMLRGYTELLTKPQPEVSTSVYILMQFFLLCSSFFMFI